MALLTASSVPAQALRVPGALHEAPQRPWDPTTEPLPVWKPLVLAEVRGQLVTLMRQHINPVVHMSSSARVA